jgi:hypothetical protein
MGLPDTEKVPLTQADVVALGVTVPVAHEEEVADQEPEAHADSLGVAPLWWCPWPPAR